MVARPCYVATEAGTVPGVVLHWWREGQEWHALVRFRAPGPGGYVLGYERRFPSASVSPRAA